MSVNTPAPAGESTQPAGAAKSPLTLLAVAFGSFPTLLLAGFAIYAWTQVPEEMLFFIPGKGGGIDLGYLPSLPLAVLASLGALSGVIWMLRVAGDPARNLQFTLWFPRVSYAVLGLAFLAVLALDDTADTGRILVGVGVFVVFGLFVFGTSYTIGDLVKRRAAAEASAAGA